MFTSIVQLNGLPAATMLPTLFVLLTIKSANWVSVSVSVAVLLPGVGSVIPAGIVTVAVFTRLPVAAAEMVALTV